jgi:hypothetical protein
MDALSGACADPARERQVSDASKQGMWKQCKSTNIGGWGVKHEVVAEYGWRREIAAVLVMSNLQHPS